MKNTSRYAIYAVIAIAAASAIGIVVMTNAPTDKVIPVDKEDTTPEIITPIESTQDLKKFSSADELRKFLIDAHCTNG